MISADPAEPRSRRAIGWTAIAFAGLALGLVAMARARGGTVTWIAWVLPFLIAANVGASTFGLLRPWPRLARLFPYVSIAVAFAIIVAELASLTRR